MGRHSKYESMSKEEILAEMRAKNKERDSAKWKKTCTLTKAEGEKLENEILPRYECANASQFLKRIVNGELSISDSNS